MLRQAVQFQWYRRKTVDDEQCSSSDSRILIHFYNLSLRGLRNNLWHIWCFSLYTKSFFIFGSLFAYTQPEIQFGWKTIRKVATVLTGHDTWKLSVRCVTLSHFPATSLFTNITNDCIYIILQCGKSNKSPIWKMVYLATNELIRNEFQKNPITYRCQQWRRNSGY